MKFQLNRHGFDIGRLSVCWYDMWGNNCSGKWIIEIAYLRRKKGWLKFITFRCD